MAYRGRGTLEINPSNNPFLQTTASTLSMDPKTDIQWKSEVNPTLFETTFKQPEEKFSFLYTKTSDTIGSHIEKNEKAPRMMTKTEFLKKRKEQLLSTIDASSERTIITPPPRPSAEELLSHYRQGTKAEDPRYTTSSNEIGKKAPTISTIVAERVVRPQGFSSTFTNMKVRSSSLNTSVTRSQVHPYLDNV